MSNSQPYGHAMGTNGTTMVTLLEHSPGPCQGYKNQSQAAQVPLGMAVGTYVAALLAQVPVAVVVSANVGWCFGCAVTFS